MKKNPSSMRSTSAARPVAPGKETKVVSAPPKAPKAGGAKSHADAGARAVARRANPPSGWRDWTGGKPDTVVMVDLDDRSSPETLEKLARIVAALGWEADTYLEANSDISVADEEGGFVWLLAHFLRNGVTERRRFSRTIEIPKAYVIEQTVRCGEYILFVGWSETPLADPNVVIRCESGEYALLPASHVGLWRDDVARHLGVPVKKHQHGFLLLAKAPHAFAKADVLFVIRDGTQLLLGSIAPRIVELDEFMRSVFQLLQDKLSYEEMVHLFGEHYGFLEFLRLPMEGALAEAPAEFRFGPLAKHSEAVDLSVCAVLLGKSVLLKPFLSSLMQHRPKGARWEILLLANAGLDLENIKSAAEWCGEVYGAEVRAFSSRHNLGFGGGMNLLVTRARGRFAMMSNIDLHFKRFDMKEISREIGGRDTVLAAYQFNPGGSLQHEGLVHEPRSALVNGRQIILLDTRLLGRNTYPKELQRKEVDYFGAACIISETAVLNKLGPFSASYFYAYHEDCDLAWRARATGVKCVLSPALQVVHYESSGTVAISMPLRAINAANLVSFVRATGGSPADVRTPE